MTERPPHNKPAHAFSFVSGRSALLLASFFLAVESVILLIPVLTDQSAPRPFQYIAVGIGASVFWILFLLTLRRVTGSGRKLVTLVALIIGLTLRLSLAFGVPEQTHMSDDVYRYVWDAKVTANGMNPFGISPEKLRFTALPDTTIYPKVNHPDLPTIYPPMSQFFFLLGYLISPDSVFGFKVVSFIMELLALLVFWRLAKECQVDPGATLIYWLAPLALLEFSYSAHHDTLALPFIGLALIFYQRRLPGWTGVMLVCATLCKFIVGLTIPALFLAFEGRNRLKFIIAAACAVLVLYFPYWAILHPPELFGSLFTYLSRWQYNGSVYTVVERTLSVLTDSSLSWARLITGAGLVVVLVIVIIKVKDRIRAAIYTLLAYVCLTPTLFPWYLAVFFPFLIIRNIPAVLALMSLVGLSYWGMIGYLDSGSWYDNYWLRALSYLPFYSLIFIPRLRNGFMNKLPLTDGSA